MALSLAASTPVAAQEAPGRGCHGLPFWVYSVTWYHPDILAELTQQNGPRSRAELDAVALELVRSAVEPDEDRVMEQIETHWEPVIRAAAEEAAEGPCYDADVVDDMVAFALESEREVARSHAGNMAAVTLRLATHRNEGRLSRFGREGTAYDGDGAFDAARVLFMQGGGLDLGLLDELNPERALRVLQAAALSEGSLACDALYRLRWWRGDEEGEVGHASFDRLRRESPERCPELDDPGPGA